MRRTGSILTTGALVALWCGGAQAQATDPGLSDLLLKQTQEFSDAGQAGDTATMARLLDNKVVFMNETGQIVGKQDMVGGEPSPPHKPTDRSIKTTEFKLTQQRPDLATATFVDVLTQDFHGQTLVYRYRSTETWAKQADGWKMIASQTMYVPQDPKAVSLPAADLDAYAGTYEVDPSYKVVIKREGDGLTASSNGGAPVALKAEARDVLFVAGAPTNRRIFQRDAAGHVTGYLSRRDGTDIVLTKVS
jgi:ketosteroid isomerase-like protein